MEIKIESLHIYPLKSAKGVKLQKMNILKTGPQWDREWMLIGKDKDFISQRKIKEMCLLEQQISEENLVFQAPGMESLKVPLTQDDAEEIEVSLFTKPTKACLVGSFFDQWFSDFLKQEVQLVRSPQQESRHTSGNHGPKTELLFPDGYPFLMTTLETLAELNSKLDQPARMDQFRPNIVVSGVPANEEENWKSFKIGEITFDSVKACTRCPVITIDQQTAQQDKNVMKTLNTYRKKEGQVIFGRNLIHKTVGSISINDKLNTILE